jgi:dTDP-glucose 4,6-dehydratase/UDP-glucose 4-epimerase
MLLAQRPDFVVHCAGTSSVDRSWADPAADFRNNVLATECVLEGLAEASPRAHFVFISSAAVYGDPAALPITEATPADPISPYGFHKLMCESACRKYHRLWGIGVTILRVFSAYGPGLAKQVLWDINRKSRESGVIALDGTGDERRDFVYVDDVARVVAGVINVGRISNPSHKPQSEFQILNIASGESVSIRELAARLLTLVGRPRGVVFSGRVRAGAPRFWEVDVSALKRLGLAPQVPLDAGLRRYARWLNEREDQVDASRLLASPG